MFTGSTLTSGQSKSGSTKISVQVKNKIHNFDMDTKREVIESGKKKTSTTAQNPSSTLAQSQPLKYNHMINSES